MRIIFAWWWSWGHLLPSIAIADRIKWDILFICSKSDLDTRIISKTNYKFKSISAWKIRRYFDLKNFSDALFVILWVVESLYHISRFKPEVIFCKWWFVCLPVAIAWWILRKRIVLHESDSVMWIANQIVSKFSTKIIMWLKQDLNPIRFVPSEIQKKDLDTNKKILFVMWWSQWAKQLNDLIVDIFPNIKKSYFVIHLTWIWKKTSIKDKDYIQFEFLDKDYPWYLKASDIVISSIAEILAFNKVCILVPLWSSAWNHQEINAKYIYDKNLCFLLNSKELSSKKVIELLDDKKQIVQIHDKLITIKPKNVIAQIIKLLKR